MSLRDRLEAKARRHHHHRILTGDLEVVVRLVQVAEAEALAAAVPGGDPVVLAERQAALEAARADVGPCFTEVDFQSLPPDAYEALVAAHTEPEGDLDTAAVLPHLAAACAVDEGLQDTQWWAAQLASVRWTKGERDDLYHELYLLNYGVPGPGPGKG